MPIGSKGEALNNSRREKVEEWCSDETLQKIYKKKSSDIEKNRRIILDIYNSSLINTNS